jgi:chemotaxis protein histidine kinase CheA
MSKLDEESLLEFKVEAEELLEQSEKSLLSLERNESFGENYNSVFRVFHSLKGAAGMLDLKVLQEHMHKTETLFQSYKTVGALTKRESDFFLKAVDAAREILNGTNVVFDYSIGNEQAQGPGPEGISQEPKKDQISSSPSDAIAIAKETMGLLLRHYADLEDMLTSENRFGQKNELREEVEKLIEQLYLVEHKSP